MNATVFAPLIGLLLVLVLRPWRWCDESNRDVSALIAGALSALIFLGLCRAI